MSKPTSDVPQRRPVETEQEAAERQARPKGDGTVTVEVTREKRLEHEAELKAQNQRRDDNRALVQAIFDGIAKLLPRFFAGCGLLALIGLGALAIVYGVPIAIRGLGVDVSTITTGTTVTTTDGATTVTSSTATTATKGGAAPDTDGAP